MKLYATGGRDLMEFVKGSVDRWPFNLSPTIDTTGIWEWMEYYDQDEAHLVEITLPHTDESLAPYRFGNNPAAPANGWNLPSAMAAGHPLRITTYRRRHTVWRNRHCWDGPVATPLPSDNPLGD